MSKKPESSLPDDERAKFEAALEAKKHKSGHGSGTSGSGGSTSKEHASRSGGKREFRRKSGG
ncbi:MAG: DUF5302 family protein [Actinomycetes bacterium]